jgi:hypothetical protein
MSDVFGLLSGFAGSKWYSMEDFRENISFSDPLLTNL